VSLRFKLAAEALEVRWGWPHLEISPNEVFGAEGVAGVNVSGNKTDVLCPPSCIDGHRLWLTNLLKRGQFERECHGFGGHRLEEDGTTPSDE
jgi:hypothetical protein